MSILKSTLVVAALAVAAISPAFAAPIPGPASFDINGSFVGTGGATFDQSTGIDFGTGTGPIVYGTPGGTIVLGGAVNPVYTAAGFVLDTVGTATDIATGNLTLGTKNIANFYRFQVGSNVLSFDLGAITAINRQAAVAQPFSAPNFQFFGTGTVNLTGYEPTAGIFSFATSNAGTGFTATFQSSAIANQVVPEPASMAVLGMGLAGLSLVRRRKA